MSVSGIVKRFAGPSSTHTSRLTLRYVDSRHYYHRVLGVSVSLRCRPPHEMRVRDPCICSAVSDWREGCLGSTRHDQAMTLPGPPNDSRRAPPACPTNWPIPGTFATYK